MTIRWFVVVALAMWVAGLALGYGAGKWDEAGVWAIGGVIVAVISLHDRR